MLPTASPAPIFRAMSELDQLGAGHKSWGVAELMAACHPIAQRHNLDTATLQRYAGVRFVARCTAQSRVIFDAVGTALALRECKGDAAVRLSWLICDVEHRTGQSAYSVEHAIRGMARNGHVEISQRVTASGIDGAELVRSSAAFRRLREVGGDDEE